MAHEVLRDVLVVLNRVNLCVSSDKSEFLVETAFDGFIFSLFNILESVLRTSKDDGRIIEVEGVPRKHEGVGDFSREAA